MRKLEVQDLGEMRYTPAFALQERTVAQRKLGEIPDRLLLVEHPHVITLGRNGHLDNLLASPEVLERSGIEYHQSNRGGDITYHGPGQIVGYPIIDLKDWKRDVVAYVRELEQVLIDAIAGFGIVGERSSGHTGVWVEGHGKIAAIGVHISRWITSHGFALNVTTDLRYFQYIVPCGLTKPVTSMQELGFRGTRGEVSQALAHHFAERFGYKEPDSRNLLPASPELLERVL